MGPHVVDPSWVIITGMDPLALFSSGGLEGAQRIFGALLTPDWDILGEALMAMVETIYLAFMATAIAVPFSFLLSFFSARNLMNDVTHRRIAYVVLRFITNFSRSIEPLIWAIVFSVWVGIGPFAGMLALVVHTIASLTKQYAEQIEDVDHGPMEAITATGASRTQVIWFSVVPQCVIPFLSFTIYRWDINVRMATVIGLVGGGGIGNMLIQYQGLAQWNEVGAIVIIIAVVVWIMDVISARVREALK
jgi:phosphonate transport system permease protein